MSDARKALSASAADRVQRMPARDQTRWSELWEDAVTDFQRACLEAALLAGHPLPTLHAFGDAIRVLDDGSLAQACRPPVGDADQDPLRAFQLNGRVLSPRSAKAGPAVAPVTVPKPHLLMDISGGRVPPRYGNVFEAMDASGYAQGLMGGLKPPDTERLLIGDSDDAWFEAMLNAAGGAWGIQFDEQEVDAQMRRTTGLLNQAADALRLGIPVPVLLGSVLGERRRAALLLQVTGEAPRRAFQLHDPMANETAWVNHKDLIVGRELPLEDHSLRRITVIVLPRT